MSIWANPEIWPFFRIRYLNFFLIPVVQEYLNEIAPTLHGPNKLKTSGKPQRIADLQTPASGQDNPASLYIYICLILKLANLRRGYIHHGYYTQDKKVRMHAK